MNGLLLPGTQIALKVAQYADDITVFVTLENDFSCLAECQSLYEQGSGARLNMTKSRGLFVGPWRTRIDTPLSLNWRSDCIRLLGIEVGPDKSLNVVNWQSAIDKMHAVFRAWKQRDLSLCGRALVARAYATSKLWYVAQVVPAALSLLDKVNSDVWQFIWKGHAELVSRRVCCCPPRAGGIGGFMVRGKVAAFQLQWIAG